MTRLADPSTHDARGRAAGVDYVEGLDEITGWLESLGQDCDFRLNRLFEIIDLLDEAARGHDERLVREYLATSRQQKFQEVKLWTRGFDFASALCGAMLCCVRQYRGRAAGRVR